MRRSYMWLSLLIVLVVVGSILAILFFSIDSGVSDTNSRYEQSVIGKLVSLMRPRFEFLQGQETPNFGQQNPVKDKYVMSYGVRDGKEDQLVRGTILRWGETFVELETAERINYPLLLPNKTLYVRCMPETITTSSGQVLPTRNVYVDMTSDPYKGVLMSVYNAPTVLPVGNEVLALVNKDVRTNELYLTVMAGYGCDNGSEDPLERQEN